MPCVFRAVQIVPALMLCVILLGCSSGVKPPATVPVSGTVTLDGSPLDKALVMFIPAEPGGATAGGTTNAEGKFELSQGPYSGAQPGAYKVVIEHWVQRDGKPVPDEIRGDIEQLKLSGAARLSIPKKYTDPNQSGLTADVGFEGAANTFDFPLTAK